MMQSKTTTPNCEEKVQRVRDVINTEGRGISINACFTSAAFSCKVTDNTVYPFYCGIFSVEVIRLRAMS